MDMTRHAVSEYLDLFKAHGLLSETNINGAAAEKLVEYVSYDSRDVINDTLFICKGAHFERSFLISAIVSGAFCYMATERYDLSDMNLSDDKEPSYIIVSDMRAAMALAADFYYNQIWKDIKLVGITGTKGKSTTTYYVKYILDAYLEAENKMPSAVLSGIDNYDGVINEESHLTTPETLMLHQHFSNAVKSGIEYLTMEVSSQALKYHRTKGVIYDVACFLNIGEDHISDIEHPDFDDYYKAKLMLFDQCNAACVNMDMDMCADEVLATAKQKTRTVSFGTKSSDVDIYGYDIRPSEKGIKFRVKTDSFDEEFAISMTGLFNVENALAAIASAYILNIPVTYIRSGLKEARVSGRMEMFQNSDGKIALVDYAHNYMSFDTLFKSMKKEYPGREISIVFGCPGKKALGRRRELGTLAGQHADRIFITEEDAGEEPVMKISEEIVSYIKAQGGTATIIVDREEAIKEALTGGAKDGIVLITGKGRETRQKRGTQYIETPSDIDYVEKYL